MENLKKQVQALSLIGREQVSLYPDGCAKADELALDFDNWYSVARRVKYNDLSDAQKVALEALDKELERMSGEENRNLWTNKALLESPRWENIRSLSQDTLNAFGWKKERPW